MPQRRASPLHLGHLATASCSPARTPASGPSGSKPITENWSINRSSDFNQADWLAQPYQNAQRAARPVDPDEATKSAWRTRTAFRLRGQSATLAGKPDLLVLQNNQRPRRRRQKRPRTAVAQVPAHDSTCTPCRGRYPNIETRHFAGEIIYPTHNRPRSAGRHPRRLHPKPRQPDPPHRRRQTRHPRSQRLGVPFLRHHHRRLPRAHRQPGRGRNK